MPYLQTALPLGMILWLAIWPLRGRARLAHSAMTAALLGAMILWFQWLWPSVYAPVALVLLLGLAILLGRRRAADRRNPRFWPGALAVLVAMAAGVAMVWLVGQRLRPPGLLDLTTPFAAPAVVIDGGTGPAVNRHRAVLDADSPSLTGWRGQADAATLRPVDHLGRPLTAPQPVTAPCDGTLALTGADPRLGRHVTLACGEVWVVLSGLSAVSVTAGPVRIGQPVGQALTLTIHAQAPGTPDHPFSGASRPISLNGTYPVRAWVLRP